MKRILLFVFLIIILIPNSIILAEEVGRFQAMAIPPSNKADSRPSIFIIDTKNGYMWAFDPLHNELYPCGKIPILNERNILQRYLGISDKKEKVPLRYILDPKLNRFIPDPNLK